MKPPRLTIRRLMILVALVALVIGLVRRQEYRRARFLALSKFHADSMDGLLFPDEPAAFRRWSYSRRHGRMMTEEEERMEDYHFEMHIKYRKAAEHPFWPLPADPPAPTPAR